MTLTDFLAHLNTHKSAIEHDLGISRYPYQTLDNWQRLADLFTAAGMTWPATLSQGDILDVGCGDGDLGFYLSHLGHRVDLLDYRETNQNQLRMAEAFASRLPGNHSVLSTDLDRGLNRFDRFYSFAITLGLLYHLKNPFLLLEDLATVTNYTAVSTRIVDKAVLPDKTPGAYLVSDNELGTDNTNYWLFNSAGFRRLAERSGWRVLSSIRFGATRAGDTNRHDAREALLLASKFSVFPDARIRSGLHRVEFSSYRWTHPRFEIELLKPATTLALDYYLPENIAPGHRIQLNGEDLTPKPVADGFRVEAHLSPTTTSCVIECQHSSSRLADARPLGVVLKLDGAQPPVRLLPSPRR